MFSRGARFIPEKESDVPGPNAYDINDPHYDGYKRGAFLEKADRFLAEKENDIPGPGAYDSDGKTIVSRKSKSRLKPSSSNDRYAVLQKKVEDLEMLYQDGKRNHLIEVEKLKTEAGRYQKTVVEQAERIEKYKKQNEAYNTRLQELKATAENGHSETKNLRAKLRAAQHEIAQLSARPNEEDAKKDLQALEMKRKEEIVARDKKIVELEKALSAEKKKRESAEARVASLRGKQDFEVQQVNAASQILEAELRATRADAQRAKSSLDALRGSEDDLLLQLEQHKTALSRCAEEYARLVSSTILKSEYTCVKEDLVSCQLRVHRLERKLANSEGQVVELANLIRCTKDNNSFLSGRLRETEEEVAFYRSLLQDVQTENVTQDYLPTGDWQHDLDTLGQDIYELELATRRICEKDARIWSDFYRLTSEDLLLRSSALQKHLDDRDTQIAQHAKELSAASSKQDELQTELETVDKQLHDTTAELVNAKGELSNAQDKVTVAEAQAAKAETSLAREKEANRRLASVIQQSRVAEQALKSDIEQLTSELSEVDRYQEAYYNLLNEVGTLVERNALAEDEAERLSRFNAEILGHHNPAQRIMYVDRIRRELHDTKQHLLLCTRDRDAVLDENEGLRQELALFNPVVRSKPRPMITRVTRLPLGDAGSLINSNAKSTNAKSQNPSLKGSEGEPWAELEYKEGDMTIDEIY